MQLFKVWLSQFGQRLRAAMEREYGTAEDHFVIAVREHSATGADGDKSIVGHLSQEFLCC